MTLRILAPVLLAGAACGDDGARGIDASVPADTDAAVVPAPDDGDGDGDGDGGGDGGAPLDAAVPPAPDPELAEGASVYFIDPNGGSDDNDGRHATDRGDGRGPWMSLTRADGFTFTVDDELYVAAGSVLTGQQLRHNDSVQGSAEHRFVIGAYHLDGAIARRGTGGTDKPILQGTLDFPDHEGNSVLDPARPRPALEDLYPTDVWAGLLHFEGNSHLEIENLVVRRSGGRGLYVGDAVEIVVRHVDCDGAIKSCVQVKDVDDVLVEDVWAKGDAMAWKFYGDEGWPSNVSVSRSAHVVLRRVHTWDGWGEGINSWYGNEDIVIEDCVSVDNRAVGFYIDSTRDFVHRRNLAMRTGRANYHRYEARGALYAFNNEDFQFTTGGGSLTPEHVAGMGVFANNIAIGGSNGISFWGQQEASDFADVYIYGFLGIDSDAQIGDPLSPMTGSRIWDSILMSLAPTSSDFGSDDLRGALAERNHLSGGATGDWVDEGNVDDVTLTHVDGWRELETWVDRSLPDGSFTKEELQELIDLVRARARPIAGGGWEGGGHAIADRVFPAGVTADTGPLATDYDDLPYAATADVGPFRSASMPE